MTRSPAPKKRRQRRHGDLPAGFRWRDGRPRWEPSPARRAAGWRGLDLKDAWGRWLELGPAVERAGELAAGVEAWARGEAVGAALAGVAPKGCQDSGRVTQGLPARSVGALRDDYFASLQFRRLRPRTQADYRGKIARFLGEVRGKVDAERFERMDIDVLLPPAFGHPGDDVLADAYDALRESAGEAMAAGCVAATGAWLGWLVRRKRLWTVNPIAGVERVTLGGRIVVFDWPEVVALVRAADAAGRASIGDAIVLAVDLSWSQQDLLALTWGQIDDAWRVKHRRIKTGVLSSPPLLALGKGRLNVITERWREARVRPTHVIVCELTGKPWSAHTFRHEFAAIRATAAKEQPSILGKTFRDLRDTAVTYAYEAGLDVPEICSRTQHNPTRAQAVIEKHYGMIRQGIADAGAAKLDAHFIAAGYQLEGPKTASDLTA